MCTFSVFAVYMIWLGKQGGRIGRPEKIFTIGPQIARRAERVGGLAIRRLAGEEILAEAT